VLDTLVLFRSGGCADAAGARVAVEEVLPSASSADAATFAMELLLLCIEIKKNANFTEISAKKKSTLLAVLSRVLD